MLNLRHGVHISVLIYSYAYFFAFFASIPSTAVNAFLRNPVVLQIFSHFFANNHFGISLSRIDLYSHFILQMWQLNGTINRSLNDKK